MGIGGQGLPGLEFRHIEVEICQNSVKFSEGLLALAIHVKVNGRMFTQEHFLLVTVLLHRIVGAAEHDNHAGVPLFETARKFIVQIQVPGIISETRYPWNGLVQIVGKIRWIFEQLHGDLIAKIFLGIGGNETTPKGEKVGVHRFSGVAEISKTNFDCHR